MSVIATIMPDRIRPQRHRWADPVRYPYKTERTCLNCDLVKVTRHEPGEHPWLEFWRNGERVICDRTPMCEMAEVAFS